MLGIDFIGLIVGAGCGVLVASLLSRPLLAKSPARLEAFWPMFSSACATIC